MSEYKSVIFGHGIFADDYEKQANEQGYTFGSRAERMQKVGYGLVFAHKNGIITNSEYYRIMRRFSNFLGKNLKPYGEGTENGRIDL